MQPPSFLEIMIREAEECAIRTRMHNTGESEEHCRSVVMHIRSNAGVTIEQANARRSKAMVRFRYRMNAKMRKAG
jgi:hypothetical protein